MVNPLLTEAIQQIEQMTHAIRRQNQVLLEEDQKRSQRIVDIVSKRMMEEISTYTKK